MHRNGYYRAARTARARRRRRPVRRLFALMLVLLAAGVVVSVASTLLAVVLTAGAVVGAVTALAWTIRTARRVRRREPLRARRTAPRPIPQPRGARESWEAARGRFDALRAEYAAYECDPLAVLRLPALADVSVASTARFVDAFAEAQALDTESMPPRERVEAYRDAVDRACRAWDAARGAAERIRLAGFTPQERATVERVIKLLTVARDSGHEAERAAAYAKARTELTRLERDGRLHVPLPALAALDEAARASLPSAGAATASPFVETAAKQPF